MIWGIHQNIWMFSSMKYGILTALLLIFGIFFAWETRKVQIEALNDSRQIGICVYNVMIMSAVGVPMVNLLSFNQVSFSFAVTSVAILVCATTTLVLVFASKVKTLIIFFKHLHV